MTLSTRRAVRRISHFTLMYVLTHIKGVTESQNIVKTVIFREDRQCHGVVVCEPIGPTKGRIKSGADSQGRCTSQKNSCKKTNNRRSGSISEASLNAAGAREGLPSSPCLNTGDPRAWMLFLSRHGLPSVCVRPQLDLQHKQAAQGTPHPTTHTRMRTAPRLDRAKETRGNPTAGG